MTQNPAESTMHITSSYQSIEHFHLDRDMFKQAGGKNATAYLLRQIADYIEQDNCDYSVSAMTYNGDAESVSITLIVDR